MTRFEKLAGIAAAVALFVYALACRPAWSPDSSMVAYTCSQGDLKTVAIHHVKTGKTVAALSFGGTMKDVFPQSFFGEAGLNIIGIRDPDGSPKDLVLIALDPNSQAINRIETLELDGKEPSPTVQPVLDAKGGIWLSGLEDCGCSLLRIAPDFKSFEAVGPERTISLARGGERFFYAHHVDKGQCAEIGIFHPAQRKFEALGSADEPIVELTSLVAAAPDGSACCVAMERAEGRFSLLLADVEDGTIERIDLPETCDTAGSVVFDSDSESVWFLMSRKKEGSADLDQLLLANVHPEKPFTRRKELLCEKDIDDDFNFILQPALSPDGRWLAISNMPNPADLDEEGGLLLIDMRSPELESRWFAPPPPAGTSTLLK